MKSRSTVLTKEERDVLILTALHPDDRHLSNSEVGQRLGISVSKVKTVIHQACVKLEAHSRTEAIFFAVGRGEVSIGEVVSLSELADMLSEFGPDVLRGISHLVRPERERGQLPANDEPVIRTDRRQGGVLTNRERDVLILAGHGLTNLEIADRLCISTSAVRTFLNRASTKLGARTRADAVVLALKQREISVAEMSSLDEVRQFLAPLGAESIEKIAQLLEQKQGREPTSTGR
jgi:DNA-binding CsgD family transcriptional regulator